MQLHYYRDPRGNFGDDINEWLWPRLVPDWWTERDDFHFCGIGTLIDATMPAASRWIVFSSGAGYGPLPRGFGGPEWTISCVRGPLTAKVLGLPPQAAVTDGAILLATLPEYKPLPESERAGVVFMPHHHALREGAWDLACRQAGIEFIDPCADSRATLERIRRARLVIADAMHAAIVADALRVPWLPVMTSPEINTFKWLDWTMSMGLPYEPVALPASALSEQIQSLFLPLYGHRYALRNRSVEAALRHFQRHRTMKSLPYWPALRNLGRAAFTRVARPALMSAPLRRWRNAEDRRRLERASESLALVSSRPGYLSDDRTLSAKQDQFLSKLAEIDAMWRQLSAKAIA